MTDTLPSHAHETPTAARRAVVVPERPALEGLEEKWAQAWQDQQTYAFDRTKSREEIYAIVPLFLGIGLVLLVLTHRFARKWIGRLRARRQVMNPMMIR